MIPKKGEIQEVESVLQETVPHCRWYSVLDSGDLVGPNQYKQQLDTNNEGDSGNVQG